MVTQQLLDFIKERHSKGVFPEAISTQLLQSGWSQTDINQAFSLLNIPNSVLPNPYEDKPAQATPGPIITHPKTLDATQPRTPILIIIIACVMFLYGLLIILAPFVLFGFFLPPLNPIFRSIVGFLGSTSLGLIPLFSGDQWINNATGDLSIVVIIRATSFLLIPFGLWRLKLWALYLFTFITLLLCIGVGFRFLMLPYIQAFMGVGINITASLLILVYLWSRYPLFNKKSIFTPLTSRIFPQNTALKIITISIIFFLFTLGVYLAITPKFNRDAIQKLVTYSISKGEKSPAKFTQKNISGKLLLKDVTNDKDGWGSWKSPLLMYDIQSKSIKTLKSDEYEGFGKSLSFLMSPNGKYIATTQTSNAFTVGQGFKEDPRDGEIALYLYNIESDTVIKAYSKKTSWRDTNTEIDQMRWLSDSTSILFTTVDKNAGYVHKAYRYELDTKNVTQILDTSSSVSPELSKYNTTLQVHFSNIKDTAYITHPIYNDELVKTDIAVYKKDTSNSDSTKLIDMDILKNTGKKHASNIKISPHGDWLAFIVEDGYKEGYSLWIVDIIKSSYQKVAKVKENEKNIVHLINPSLDGKNLLYYEYGYQGEDFKYYLISPLEYPEKKPEQILIGECSRVYDEEDVYNNLQFALTTTSRKCLGSNTDQWNIFDLYDDTKVLEFDESFASVINNRVPVGYYFTE